MAERTAPSQRSSMPKIRKGKSAPRIRSKGYDQSRWQKELYHQRSSTPRIRKGKSAPRIRSKGYDQTRWQKELYHQRSSTPRIRKGKPAPRARSKGQTVITAKRQQRKPQVYREVHG